MNNEDFSGSRFPLKLLTVTLVLTGAAFVWFNWTIYHTYSENKISVMKKSRIEELRSDIIHLDEVLTMSARLAAATGDLQWETRYHEFEPQLDAAIKEAIKLVPTAYSGEAATQTNAANSALVEMENQAFELVRQGRSEEARAVLFSDEYEKQKQIYAEGMTRFAFVSRPDFRLEELRGIITHLDEVLTMSARMAAATGDLRWEAHYLKFEPQLDAAINEARKLAPRAHGEKAAAQTNAANIALVEMEIQAFELVRQGRFNAAQAILSSDKYKTQKKVYAEGMMGFTAALRQAANATLNSKKQEFYFTIGTAVVVFAISIIAWFVMVRNLNTWRKMLSMEIAERVQAEDELRKLSTAVEQSPATVVITDTEGTIEYVNPSFTEVTGYTAEEAIGENPSILKSGNMSSDAYRQLWEAIAAGEVWRGEFHNKKKNGELFWEAASISPIRNSEGVITNFLAVKEDITKRKNTETALRQYAEDLKRSNQGLDDFAYIASHDLKEPLRGMTNYAGFLIEDYQDKLDDEGHTKLETLQRLATRMETLIDSLLYYSRLGRTELSCHKTNLNKVLQAVLDSMQIPLHEKNIEIRKPKPLPTMHCDRVRITEVFRNLITNAIKYNDKPEKWIEVGVLEKHDSDSAQKNITPGKHPVFYVSDNGIGIRDRHLDKIFTIFKRLHAKNKYGGGTGAGLTIVKKIIERHGGRIWVESAYGEGTTFFFTLENTGVNNKITVVNESEVGQQHS